MSACVRARVRVLRVILELTKVRITLVGLPLVAIHLLEAVHLGPRMRIKLAQCTGMVLHNLRLQQRGERLEKIFSGEAERRTARSVSSQVVDVGATWPALENSSAKKS